jgi:hypothetical protein
VSRSIILEDFDQRQQALDFPNLFTVEELATVHQQSCKPKAKMARISTMRPNHDWLLGPNVADGIWDLFGS